MNPFILLLKPMIAAGLFVTKMFVAVGYLVTEGHAPPPEQKPIAEQVRIAVVPSPSGLESMELEMPNGELFQLSGATAPPEPDDSAEESPSSRPRSLRARSESRADVVATLESTLGRSMQCDVTLPHESEKGCARCTVQAGESYVLAF